MTDVSFGPITQMQTTSPTLYAFAVSGRIDDDASEAMAKYMNAAFDRHDSKVDMLLDLTACTGSDWDSFLDKDVIVSRFRALSNVGKYAVIGAPERATKMINLLDSVIPMDARAFPSDAVEAAWSWVGEERPAA